MVTLGEAVRWVIYTVGGLYQRLAARLLRRDRLVARSERRFRALLEAAPDAIVIVDWHGHIALVNAQAEALFRYRRDELIGQNVTELIPRRFRDVHREHQKHYLRDARVRPMGSGLELFGRRSDGSEFPIEISLSPLETDQGLLVTSAIRDVSARKEIEAQLTERAAALERSNAALERSNADLEQFAYVASHDLSAPLRVISGFVELLRKRYEGRLDDDADEFIGHTVEGVRRMQSMIDDLLAYARVASPQAEPGRVESAEVVGRVLATLGDDIAASHADVSVDDLPAVRGEPTQVEQLFQNVIGNALKFTNSGRPRIDVSVTRQGEWWRFAVRDNGIGIDPAHAESAFQMFRRLNRPDEYPGTGIGLAICKRIVEHVGGQIGADPAPDGGTILWFTLPAAEPPTERTPA